MSRAVLKALLLAAAAAVASAETLIVMGDGVSDNGNYYRESGQTTPTPDQGYYNGRFSNGPVWNDYLASDTGFQIFNTAYPSAQACEPAVANAGLQYFVPYLAQQTNWVAGNVSTFDRNQAVFIAIGANDIAVLGSGLATRYRNNMTYANEQVNLIADCIKMTVEGLLKYRITKNLVVSTVPNIAYQPQWTPAIQTFNLNAAAAAQLLANIGTTVRTLNDRIWSDTALLANKYQNSRVTVFDMYAYLSSLVADSSVLGFTNTTGACLEVDPWYIGNGVSSNTVLNRCSNPDQHMFWDYSYPTTAVHRVLAERIGDHLATSTTLYRAIAQGSK